MTRSLKMAACSVLTLSILALTGCGGDPKGPELVPVRGVVKWKGSPLAGAKLTFIPMGDTQGNGGSAVTNAEGAYEVTYVRGGEGLPVGQYKVAISKRVMPDGSAPPEDVPEIESPARETLPASISSQEQTRVTRTVAAGGAPVDFTLP